MIALTLQVWEGDAQIGKQLMQLITAIEPSKREDVEVIISARRGTNKFAVEDLAATAKTKFKNVVAVKCKRFGTGWPSGCNDLWAETMMSAETLRRDGKIRSEAVLTIEPDCIPLRPDWINRMIAEWERAKRAGKEAIGHFHGMPNTHLNGNAIFRIGIQSKHPELFGSDSLTGWDVFHAKLLMYLGMDSPEFYQIYRLRHFKPEQSLLLLKDGRRPSLFHGIKGTLGIEAVKWMIEQGHFQ